MCGPQFSQPGSANPNSLWFLGLPPPSPARLSLSTAWISSAPLANRYSSWGSQAGPGSLCKQAVRKEALAPEHTPHRDSGRRQARQAPGQTHPLGCRSSVSREHLDKAVPVPSRLLLSQQSQDTNVPLKQKELLVTEEHRKDWPRTLSEE